MQNRLQNCAKKPETNCENHASVEKSRAKQKFFVPVFLWKMHRWVYNCAKVWYTMIKFLMFGRRIEDFCGVRIDLKPIFFDKYCTAEACSSAFPVNPPESLFAVPASEAMCASGLCFMQRKVIRIL